MAITATPTTLAFGSVTRPASATLTVTLAPDVTLDSIHGVSITGTNANQFSVTETFDAYSGVQSKNASSILTGTGTNSFTVTFTPNAAGAATANINVHHNGPGRALTTTIVATGTGV